jgi:hypothetical protein
MSWYDGVGVEGVVGVEGISPVIQNIQCCTSLTYESMTYSL